MEYVAFVLVFLISIVVIGGLWKQGQGARLLSGVLVAALILSVTFWQPTFDHAAARLPSPPDDGGYATSDSCRSCHPDQYASWHRSFHRSMTQPASPLTIRAPFDNIPLQYRGRTYKLERSGDDFWVDMVDPAWEMRSAVGIDTRPLGQAPRIRERVVMVTGSHHFQVYWTRRTHEDNGMLLMFPWVFHISDQRWIPAETSFLRPPTTGPLDIEDWNSNCILCHSVGGQPHMDEGNRSMFSQVAQFGIACEACHGEGESHVARMAAPWKRYALHYSDATATDIVNPEDLESRRATEVCGNCHSASFEIDPQKWTQTGGAYRPGDDLSKTRRILRYTDTPNEEWLIQGMKGEPDALIGRFWPDGTVRVTGREYNGLIESSCFQDGELSCLSCHSMHESDPNDQLAVGVEGDGACLQCHERFREDVESHTHHKAESSGSRCQNCHMPHTTYGLFSAIRSHRIDNPRISIERGGRPNACNLCHLDRSQGWTADYLAQWYSYPRPDLPELEETIAASVLWTLKGDAVQRAIGAWAMNWEPARQVSGEGWQGAFLGYLLDDPYAAVRYVACRSLRETPGFEDFECDFLDGSVARRDRIEEVWQRYKELSQAPLPATILAPQGTLERAAIETLLGQRDNKRIRIIE